MRHHQIFPYVKFQAGNKPAGVAGDRVPSLVLIDVDALHICLRVNIICAAGQSLEEASSVAPSVNPGCVVIADPPHYAQTVTLHHAQMTTNLPPKPEQMGKRYLFFNLLRPKLLFAVIF